LLEERANIVNSFAANAIDFQERATMIAERLTGIDSFETFECYVRQMSVVELIEMGVPPTFLTFFLNFLSCVELVVFDFRVDR
jgi:hypothetical protein